MEQLLKIESNLPDILKFFKEYADLYKNIECCGFLGKKKKKFIGQIVPNRSPEPNLFFCVDPVDFLKFSSENQMVAIFHSHIDSNALFSEQDKESSDAICIPYLLYSVWENKFSFYIPENTEVDVKILKKVKGLL